MRTEGVDRSDVCSSKQQKKSSGSMSDFVGSPSCCRGNKIKEGVKRSIREAHLEKKSGRSTTSETAAKMMGSMNAKKVMRVHTPKARTIAIAGSKTVRPLARSVDDMRCSRRKAAAKMLLSIALEKGRRRKVKASGDVAKISSGMSE